MLEEISGSVCLAFGFGLIQFGRDEYVPGNELFSIALMAIGIGIMAIGFGLLIRKVGDVVATKLEET